MTHTLLKLPWTLATVPHAALDILRGCNIRCRDCYNLRPDHVQTLTEIDAQLDTLTRIRRLQSVCIVGGEITLHPDLAEIVRRVRRRGLFVELFSNGVDLDDRLLAQLRRAGANIIYLHIEANQSRPDLPAEATRKDLERLRVEKAALVAAHGIEVGLALTGYPEKPEEVEEAVSFTLESPHVCYLLVTWWRDIKRTPPIRGSLAEGLAAESTSVLPAPGREVRPQELCQWFDHRFHLAPFAWLGSNQDQTDPRWLSFLVAAVHRQGKLSGCHSLGATCVERTFLEASHRLAGRYPFYQAQHPAQFALHLVLNGLAGGGLAGNLRLLGLAARPGARLHAKRVLFQWPAVVDEQGRVVHCHCCPDAVLKDGRLVPLCISDRVTPKEPATSEPPSVAAQV